MKKGQVYKRGPSFTGETYYHLIVGDYGKLRPLNLNGNAFLETNMSFMVCPFKKDGLETMYKKDVLVAETFTEFLNMPISREVLLGV